MVAKMFGKWWQHLGLANYFRGSLRKTVLCIFAEWTHKPLLYCKWLAVLKYQWKKIIKGIKKPENRGVDSGTNKTTMTLHSIPDVCRSGYWVFTLQKNRFQCLRVKKGHLYDGAFATKKSVPQRFLMAQPMISPTCTSRIEIWEHRNPSRSLQELNWGQHV